MSFRAFQLVTASLLVIVAPFWVRADPAPTSYAADVTAAQADLDAGRVKEAVTRLEATDKARRRFEYAYLMARAKAGKDRQAAPDLVRSIAGPKVDKRYGVLSEVDRQLVFICRDGKLHVHDLNATILHCLGIDHTKLTWKFQGRYFRLTDVFGNVIKDVVA